MPNPLSIVAYPTVSGMQRALTLNAGMSLQVKYMAVGSGLQAIQFDAGGRAITDTLANLIGYVEVLNAEKVSPYQWQMTVNLAGLSPNEWRLSEFALCDADHNVIAIYGHASQALYPVTPFVTDALLSANLLLASFPADSVTIEHHNQPLELLNPRIRSMTNAQRLALATPPAAGEPIWTTDTKKLYVGDGSKVGGKPVVTSVVVDGGSTAFDIFKGVLQYQSGVIAGSGDFEIVTRDSGASGEGYLHLDTGVVLNGSASFMGHWTIRGYNYGSNLINNEICTAYLYIAGIYHQSSTNNGMSPFFYKSSEGRAILRLKLVSQYFNLLAFDFMRADWSGEESQLMNGKFTGGRITPLALSQI